MSVNIINQPSYSGIRILVGRSVDPYYSEYIPIKGLSEKEKRKAIAAAKQREQVIKAEYLAGNAIKNGVRNHQYEKMAKNQPCIIRGVNIYFIKGVEHPSCRIYLCIFSNGKTKTFNRQMQDYTIFKQTYLQAVDIAVELYGLKRARNGWRKIPLTEDEFYASMDKAACGA